MRTLRFALYTTAAFLLVFACLARAADEEVTLDRLSNQFAAIAERLTPSVVNITCLEPTPAPDRDGDEQQGEDTGDEYGFGSGVIIEPDGYILTSNHVVEAASRIQVKFSDNRKFIARLVGQDPETDLALLKVDSPQPLAVAPLGDSSKVKPGQLVMAIGNPFVYDHTVTLGVVSALNRNLGTNIFDNFIQTDAAINFGNSGGPLLNTAGEVIGINTLISSQGTGIGFAIPINTAKEIIPQLKQKGRVSRGFLGLVPQDITPELQKSLKLETPHGVVISSVQRGTPADKAGLKRYDVILQIDDTSISSEDEFRRVIALAPPGKNISLKVRRDQNVLTLVSQITERPDTSIPHKSQPAQQGDKLGLKLQNLTARLREDYRIDKQDNGVLVESVTPGDAAFEAGLEKGDLILEVNKQPVITVGGFQKLVGTAHSGDNLLLYVYHDGNYELFALEVQ